MRNVEFKAELRDIALARTIARALGATAIATVQQTDTYYRVPQGRLKRRQTPDEPTEWIFYDRPDRAGPKVSHFVIYSEAEALERYGRNPLPVRMIVRKSREILMLGSVRIHLDHVDELGEFIEFEALVTPEHGLERARERIDALRREFAPSLGEAVACGYADLLAQGRDEAAPKMPT